MTSSRNPQANKSFFGPTLPAQKHALSATRQRHTAVTRAAKDYTVSPLLIIIALHWSQQIRASLVLTASWSATTMSLAWSRGWVLFRPYRYLNDLIAD